MTEKTTDVRSEPVEDPSTSSGAIDDGARTDAPAAERGRADAPFAQRGRRKVREGYVVSDKMDKTVVVAVEDRVKHRLYGKVLRQTSRLKAHDEQNSAAVGDRVRVMETRPLSATKRWRLVEILEKAK
jgi:small subunit ribosomal protein S17